MADNRNLAALTGNAAADEVTYSGDTAVVQLVRQVAVTGSEGSKTVVENMPASLGPKTKAESFPVTLASDEDTISVTGSTVAITGPVMVYTDTGDSVAITAAALPLPTGAATSANQLLPITATTATLTNTNDSASNVTVQASNAARKGLILFNDSTQVAYVKFGATATITSFSVYLPAQGTYEMGSNVYSGQLDAIWAADGSGAMRATEW